MNIPTGIPLVYHLNEDFTVHDVSYLGDQEAIQKKLRQSRISLPSLNKDVI